MATCEGDSCTWQEDATMVTRDLSVLDEASAGQGEPLHLIQALLWSPGCCFRTHQLQEKRKSYSMKTRPRCAQDFRASFASNQLIRTTSLLANLLHSSPTPILGCCQSLSRKPDLPSLGPGIQSCFLAPSQPLHPQMVLPGFS